MSRPSWLAVGALSCSWHTSYDFEPSDRPLPDAYTLGASFRHEVCQAFVFGLPVTRVYSVGQELEALGAESPLVRVTVEEVTTSFLVGFRRDCLIIRATRVGLPAAGEAPAAPVAETSTREPARDLFAPPSGPSGPVALSIDDPTVARVQINCPPNTVLRADVVDGRAVVEGVPLQTECLAYLVADGVALRPTPVQANQDVRCSRDGKTVVCTP